MSNSALAQWAFLVLLADPDDRAGLAQLLTDVTQPEAKSRVVYLAAPVGGKKFFAKDAETTDWAVRNVSEDAQRVHLLMHEPGLRQVVANHEGLFYIGVTNRDEVRAYDGADRVTAFVTEGPLDFVPRVMHDWDGTAEAHDALFAKGAARQVLALTTDSPLSPEDLEAYGAAPEVDDGLVRAIQRSFPSAILPATSVVSDIWTVDDKLGYQPFADAIAVFLRHRDTRPPLTVGIRAPWGAGKTSLMRMIRETLDPCEADGRRSTVERVDTGQTPARGPSVATVLRIARRHGLPEQQSATVDANRLVTVWFNPWMYQTGEQIWPDWPTRSSNRSRAG